MAFSPYASLWERIVANTAVDEITGCWLWTGTLRRHYPALTLRVPEKPHPIKLSVHRLVLEISTGWLFPFDQGGHYKCFNPLCVNPDHLRIETLAENLSTRRGYKACEGRWIPVLYPTTDRLLQEAADDAWQGIGGILTLPHEECPF